MKKKTEKQEAAPTAPQVIPENKEAKPIKFVVVRDGCRVSEKEFETHDDPIAILEQEFWTLVSNNHSYGEPVKIVQYDPKKHRVW
jgi:hypothetical protein